MTELLTLPNLVALMRRPGGDPGGEVGLYAKGDDMSAWTHLWPYLLAALLTGICVGLGICSVLHAEWRVK